MSPENIDAWEAYDRVKDQIFEYPISETQLHIALRSEAIAAVIRLQQPAEPLETYDRVMIIHRVKYREDHHG